MKKFTILFSSLLLILITVPLNYQNTYAFESKQVKPKKNNSQKGKWDVNHPPYPTHRIKLNVKKGTWMNLDISPDGQWIVFDMLGDLYLIPAKGGEAKALTSSISWEMQPRFSPDGKSIVFTSDRAGGDNIWVMDLKTGKQTQITRESFRLLNNPTWSPDGKFIVARKHFTSTRSLGAGELWLYSIAGGKGVRMNVAPTKQKDLGEPAFSPDGRYVYFSQDISPGKYFEYNKDSNGTIYAIKRLDTRTNKISTFIREPGGSVRPTPSPDGRKLAYVKRIRNKTALMIKDLKSGIESVLCDCLERDMQETWAIHGVYPNIGWTSDSNSLIYWAKGEIYRINVHNKAIKKIPFHVSHFREIADSVRFTNKAWSPQSETRMLRWVEMTPDKSKVIYQALGQIYVQNLQTGKYKQLTHNKNEFAFYPSLSRDGKKVTYVSWNDQKLAKVKIMTIDGRGVKTLTREPGHYIEPRFSADGKWVYYQKIRGGYLFSKNWSMNPGLYKVAVNKRSTPKKLDVSGSQVQSGADGRLYLTQIEGSGATRKASLVAWDPGTQKSQIVAQTHFGTEFSLSPDGKWVSFVEGFEVFVAPFKAAGRIIHLSAKNADLPVKKVSVDAGENIHWADNHTLVWSHGNQLYSKELSLDLFHSNTKTNIKPQIQKIGFTFKEPIPDTTIALTHAKIVTAEKDEIIEDGTIIIKNNLIQKVGASTDFKVPEGVKTFNLKGKTIIPGIVDVHWHGSQGQEQITPQQNWKNLSSLAFGVTTIHDPSNDTREIFAASELAKAGKIVAPRIFSTGTILYGAKASIFAEVNSLDDAMKHVRRMKAAGAFSVKSYNQPRRDQRQQILTAARKLHMEVVPEGGSLFEHNMNMIVDGHTGIEHSIPVANIYDDVKQLWSQSDVGYTPTLIVGYGGIWGENYWYQHTDVWKHPILSHFVPPDVLIPRSVRRVKAPEADYNFFNNARVTAELDKLGVEVHLGAHGQREGLGAHWEMWMMAQGGMSPLEVLKAATINGAKYLGMEKQIGSIKAGKLADLVILDVDPLKDIFKSDQVNSVMINGKLYDAKTMNELTGKWKPESFYWQ